MDSIVVSESNRRVIEEFRANGGKVDGVYADRTLLLLTTTGRRSGRTYLNPVTCLAGDGCYYIFATKGGAPQHPNWFLNLVAHPRVAVEVGRERFEAVAEVLGPAERDAIYAKQASLHPHFAEYERKTTRVIPVVKLSRAG